MKKNEEQIVYCHNCGNKTTQVILHIVESIETFYNTSKPIETTDFESYFYLTKCKTCSGISLYTDYEHDDDIGNLSNASLCYPKVVKATKEIPESISETYHEALKVEKISPMAFAVLVRRTLELLCKDQKANGRNLKSQLDDLVSKNIIPATLAEMGEALRILGNLSAHDNDYKIDVLEVWAMRDFIIAMLEYVYVAPAKILKLKESINRKKKESN